MARDETFIVNKIWDELSQINMHKINKVCQQNLQIGLIGSESAIEDMITWLASFPYYGLKFPVPNNEEIRSNKEIMKRLFIISATAGDQIDGEELKTSNFCIVEPSLANKVKQFHPEVYPFDCNDAGLAGQILANNEKIRFALSHNFPVFRPEHAKFEIQETAIQNTAWVLIATLPTFLPSPHKTIVAPLHTFADFIILTVNEVKLMFELIGLLGEKIQLKHLLEFVFVFSLAKIAREIATIILRSIPTQSALIAKGALAYAFTWAIGEAVVFFIVGRQRVGWSFLKKRMKYHFAKGITQAKSMVKGNMTTAVNKI